jgi:methylglutaconyl-CoA hydratase
MFKVEREENGLVKIFLDRPDIHNAFNDEMIEELTKTFLAFSDEKNIRLISIEGNGPSFCAGADLNWMKKMKSYSMEENIEDSEKLAAMFKAINDCPYPVLAKVHGAALGGGTGILACCDYVMATHLAKFAFSEVRLGLVPAVISPFVMAKVGESQARSFFLSGMRFSAERAMQMGLVHDVVDSDEIHEIFDKTVKKFMQAGPAAAVAAKELIKNVKSSEEPTAYTCKTIAEIRVGDEAQEGMQALLDKRKPSWMNV